MGGDPAGPGLGAELGEAGTGGGVPGPRPAACPALLVPVRIPGGPDPPQRLHCSVTGAPAGTCAAPGPPLARGTPGTPGWLWRVPAALLLGGARCSPGPAVCDGSGGYLFEVGWGISAALP